MSFCASRSPVSVWIVDAGNVALDVGFGQAGSGIATPEMCVGAGVVVVEELPGIMDVGRVEVPVGSETAVMMLLTTEVSDLPVGAGFRLVLKVFDTPVLMVAKSKGSFLLTVEKSNGILTPEVGLAIIRACWTRIGGSAGGVVAGKRNWL